MSEINKQVEAIAEIAHELNRTFCSRYLGDHTHLPWQVSQQWVKDSAIAGVRNIIANPDTTPEDSHKSWLAHKEADGWVYGPKKDATAKTHPCMVPYDDLPPEQRIKDKLYTSVVRILLGAGFEPVDWKVQANLSKAGS